MFSHHPGNIILSLSSPKFKDITITFSLLTQKCIRKNQHVSNINTSRCPSRLLSGRRREHSPAGIHARLQFSAPADTFQGT
ncbi:hypothetical protein COCNU_scaffold000732G000100 [Cocos nucifera]|nr:hypothetical protein [Cocos nucifera]